MDSTGARQRWTVGLGLVLGIGAGLGGSAIALAATPPTYESTASVLVQQIGTDPPSLPTEAQLARSTSIAADAARTVGRSTQDIGAATTVEPLQGSSILLITVRGATPDAAQVAARAVATAYLANRGQTARAAIQDQTTALTARISETDKQVGALNATMARLPASSPDLATLRGSMSVLTAQLTALMTRLTDLQTTAVVPGRVIGDPELPADPVYPRPWLYRSAGAGAGALLGLLVPLARRRLARRIRDTADVARRGVPVLAHAVTEKRDNAARTFNRLRNEIIASLGTGDRVLLVAGVTPGAASTSVAASLAAAFARADTEIILVGANAPDPGTPPLSQVFDVADIPGLSDVLAGRVALPAGLQRAARLPRLRVITPGGTASAAGLLQSEGARSAVLALRQQAHYVVVEAPSTASGADAQSLARVADAAILVVEAGRSRPAQVADAAEQLRLVGTRILGAVLLWPAMAPAPVDEDRPHPLGVHDEWLSDKPSIVDAPTAKLSQVPTPAGSSTPP